MDYLNRYICRGLILLVFPILVYSCNNGAGAEPEPTIADILKNDSVELNNIIETLRNSNIDFMEFLMGRYECENRDYYFPWWVGMYHREDSDSIRLRIWGQVIEWDSITLSAHNDYPDSTLLDTLNMVNDLKDVLQSFKKIVRDNYYLIILDARNKIIGNPQLSEVVKDYVEMLLYYKKEHYLLVYAKEDELYEILNYRKKRPYKDLDIDNQCQRLYGDVYLVGFSSQEYFFKNR